MMSDRKLNQLGLLPTLGLGLTLLVAILFCLMSDNAINAGINVTLIGVALIFMFSQGFFINNPNEARIIEFFGYYVGTYFQPGMFITVPFANKRVVSLKFQNINTDKIKVNDADGNPIEISAVIVWRVSSPAKAYYNINNYYEFVSIQSDSVIRELASNYPYDSENNEESLRKNSDKISDELRSMLQQRLDIAGIEIKEARISHLAYSSEIAQAMLKRQQAHAITSARRYIVQNAIVIVEEVMAHFKKNKSIQLDEKQKAQLINNLLIALISDHDTQPTISLDNN